MIRLAVRVAREQAELVLAELLDLAPSGVEEVDVAPNVVEYAVYGAPGELPALPAVRAAVGGALVSVSTTEVADDWSQRWREFHRPVVVGGGRLVVRPSWVDGSSYRYTAKTSTEALEIVVDPGQAFGTGAHPTTQLCLELLLGLRDRTGSFLDLGCGSGVLAIAAAKLGFHPVTAADNDPAAVQATRENAAANNVNVEPRRLDLRTEATPQAGTIAANLLGPLLIAWAPKVPGSTHTVIASGLLATEVDAVRAAFESVGLHTRAQREQGEWAALRLVRDAG